MSGWSIANAGVGAVGAPRSRGYYLARLAAAAALPTVIADKALLLMKRGVKSESLAGEEKRNELICSVGGLHESLTSSSLQNYHQHL